jgi:hypothetical protein
MTVMDKPTINKPLLDLYADYLISSFGPTTATGLARLLQSLSAMTRSLDFSGANLDFRQPLADRQAAFGQLQTLQPSKNTALKAIFLLFLSLCAGRTRTK